MDPHVFMIDDNQGDLQLIEAAFQDRRISHLFHRDFQRRGWHFSISPRVLSSGGHPDIFIIDLVLPDMPGEEVVRRLRSDPATASIPVMVFSGCPEPKRIATCMKAGATGVVAKPKSYRDYERFVQGMSGPLAETDSRSKKRSGAH